MRTKDFLDSRSVATPDDLSCFGPKAGNLLRLAQGGFEVPPFLAVSQRIFERVAGPIRNEIEAILAQLEGDDAEAIENASELIGTMVTSVDFPADLAEEIVARASDIGEGGLLAVRSSNSDEDSCASSFAGLNDSFLAIAPENVAHRIQLVWASAWSARSLMFRHRMALGWANMAPGAIVQRFVNASASGVIFSTDPSEPDAVLIDAVYGLGDGVTSELAEADSYRVSKTNRTVSAKVAAKSSCVVADPGGEGVSVVRNFEGGDTPVLAEADLAEIATAAQSIETFFGAPQDIEWSMEDGKLWILQSRPIAGASGSGQWPGVWDSANIAESYPGRTLPLTFSYIRLAYQISFEDALCFLLPFARAQVRRSAVPARLLGYFRGRVYMNLLSWYFVLSHLPNFERHQPVWDRMIGVEGRVACEPARLGRLDRSTAWLMLAWVFFGNRIYTARFTRRFARFRADTKRAAFDTMDERQLVEFFRNSRVRMHGTWHLPLLNDHCAMVWLSLLEKLAGDRTGRDASVNDLLCGTGRLDSAEPIAALEEIAVRLRTHEKADRILSLPCNKALEDVRENSEFADIAARLEAYLDRFGDRRIEELKLESPSLREDPALVMGMIQVAARSNRARKAPTKTPVGARKTCSHPLRRLLVWFVRRQAISAIAARESMRMDRARLFGVVRQIFLRIGEIWARRREIDTRDDIFWLTIDEIFDCIEGCGTVQDLKDLVRLRKAELSTVSASELPARFETRGLPQVRTCNTSAPADVIGVIQGIGCATGQVTGRALQVTDPRTANVDATHIIVAKSTDPGWVFLMANAAGLVVENGSPLSHTAIIGRELGIPTVVGARNATHQIPDGATLFLDAESGRVSWN